MLALNHTSWTRGIISLVWCSSGLHLVPTLRRGWVLRAFGRRVDPDVVTYEMYRAKLVWLVVASLLTALVVSGTAFLVLTGLRLYPTTIANYCEARQHLSDLLPQCQTLVYKKGDAIETIS